MMRSLSLILLIFISHTLYSQNSITLQGKVVEIKDSKTIGVPGVVVSVSGESYDVTGVDGSFKLFAPGGLDFVTITLRGSHSTMISPFEGKISLPPSYEPIEIKLCSEANQKLMAKVQGLQTKIRKLQKENQLSARQAELLYKNMIDTISFFENKIEAYKKELTAAQLREQQLEGKILELEKENALLEEKLFKALGEKYIAQQKSFTTISQELNEYISRIKDLQMILPTDAVACAQQAGGACEKFYGYIERYNKIRNSLNQNKDLNVRAVQEHWSSDKINHSLNSTYDVIINKIHEPIVFNKMNRLIVDKIKNISAKNGNRKKLAAEIAKDAATLSLELLPVIKELDENKNKLYQLLTTEIQ